MHTNLFIARREKQLYQKDVAAKLGIHPQTYHEKECGKKDFSLREAKLLSSYFGKTMDELFQD